MIECLLIAGQIFFAAENDVQNGIEISSTEGGLEQATLQKVIGPFDTVAAASIDQPDYLQAVVIGKFEDPDALLIKIDTRLASPFDPIDFMKSCE